MSVQNLNPYEWKLQNPLYFWINEFRKFIKGSISSNLDFTLNKQP